MTIAVVKSWFVFYFDLNEIELNCDRKRETEASKLSDSEQIYCVTDYICETVLAIELVVTMS